MRRILFLIGYKIVNKRVLEKYKFIEEMSKKSEQEVEEYKFAQLKSYLIKAYENTVYYKELFDEVNFNPYEFDDMQEYKKIPLLNKTIIKKRPNDFISNKKIDFQYSRSGGSSGVPLEYRLSNEDAALSRALLFYGFSYAGYRLGDSVFTLAGGSIVSKTPSLKDKIRNYVLNQESFFTLNMEKEDYEKVIKVLKRKKPKFIRAYSQSIYRIAKYIEENKVKISYSPKAIFTTSETLSDKHRVFIEKVFNTKIYDQYGLNDSGASAFENDTHQYLVNFERSYIEFEKDNDVSKIISTSYNNDAMFFVRYDTGDNCILTDKKINNKQIFSNIVGRSTELLSFKGIVIAIPRLAEILAEIKVDRYQFLLKEKEDKLIFRYSGRLEDSERVYLKKLFKGILNGDYIVFENITEDEFILTRNGKYKAVVEQ